jgi:hypothetical protein
MANEPFNPNGYSEQEIADALKYATNDHLTVEQHSTQIQLLTTTIRDGIADLQENTIDLFRQIIYKGSANKLHLEDATLTVPEVTGLTATLANGIITIRKTAATTEDVTITLTGIALAAGEYYLSTGDSLNSRNEILSMLVYDDNDSYLTVVANNDDIGQDHTINLSTAIEDGKLEFVIDKSYASHVYFTVTPMFSPELFDKAFVMPYFQSLSEVSADA